MRAIIVRALSVALFVISCAGQVQSAKAADTQNFGNWIVGIQAGGTGMYASTVNDSGLVLGEYCYFKSKTCIWLVSADSKCDEGDKYPTLGNTDGGAASLLMV